MNEELYKYYLSLTRRFTAAAGYGTDEILGILHEEYQNIVFPKEMLNEDRSK